MAESSTTANQNLNPDTPQAAQPVSASGSSSSAQPQAEVCAQCNKAPGEGQALKPCKKCHSMFYCSKECEKAHAKTHKKECAKLANEYAKTHVPKMASRAPPKIGERNAGYQKWQFDT
ncbi:hypothetical protein M011DRAFT_471277 [Sporormia fimetaria CBS 119925]|uniref:MYND-type domain-containing protein n=1 Tax=Sporormia fimetaria CBS 119925 TaxID=1340428 RepID=A0A6A6V2K4_9PLEO|nr:hypothetical protein M011DRAFT_471277 [Sporormia fimetaria CBS 119925]